MSRKQEPDPPPPPTEPVQLEGALADAYREWRLAVADLDGKFSAYNAARERHAVALAAFTRLAVQGSG